MKKITLIAHYSDDLTGEHFTSKHDALLIRPTTEEINFTYLRQPAAPQNGVLELGTDDAAYTLEQLGSLLADWRPL